MKSQRLWGLEMIFGPAYRKQPEDEVHCRAKVLEVGVGVGQRSHEPEPGVEELLTLTAAVNT